MECTIMISEYLSEVSGCERRSTNSWWKTDCKRFENTNLLYTIMADPQNNMGIYKNKL